MERKLSERSAKIAQGIEEKVADFLAQLKIVRELNFDVTKLPNEAEARSLEAFLKSFEALKLELDGGEQFLATSEAISNGLLHQRLGTGRSLLLVYQDLYSRLSEPYKTWTQVNETVEKIQELEKQLKSIDEIIQRISDRINAGNGQTDAATLTQWKADLETARVYRAQIATALEGLQFVKP